MENISGAGMTTSPNSPFPQKTWSSAFPPHRAQKGAASWIFNFFFSLDFGTGFRQGPRRGCVKMRDGLGGHLSFGLQRRFSVGWKIKRWEGDLFVPPAR